MLHPFLHLYRRGVAVATGGCFIERFTTISFSRVRVSILLLQAYYFHYFGGFTARFTYSLLFIYTRVFVGYSFATRKATYLLTC